jgi:hypothetical protein
MRRDENSNNRKIVISEPNNKDNVPISSNKGNLNDDIEIVNIENIDNNPHINVDESDPICDDKDYLNYFVNPDKVRHDELIVNVDGDGNCLFRSLAGCLGLNISHEDLRREISKYMCNEDNAEAISAMCERHLLVEDIMIRGQEVKKDGIWGGMDEINAFELMSGINVIVYNEKLQTTDTIDYKCIKGFNAGEIRRPAVAIILGRQSLNSTKTEHYMYLDRSKEEIRAKVTLLKRHTLNLKKMTDSPRKK